MVRATIQMKVIIINQKVVMVRHWFKWFKVQRGLDDWRKLAIREYKKDKSIRDIANSIGKKYPGGKSLPPVVDTILDEAAADAEVDKNLKKAGKK